MTAKNRHIKRAKISEAKFRKEFCRQLRRRIGTVIQRHNYCFLFFVCKVGFAMRYSWVLSEYMHSSVDGVCYKLQGQQASSPAAMELNEIAVK